MDNGNSAVAVTATAANIDVTIGGFGAHKLVISNTGDTNYVFAKCNATATAAAGSIPIAKGTSIEVDGYIKSVSVVCGSAKNSTIDWYSLA